MHLKDQSFSYFFLFYFLVTFTLKGRSIAITGPRGTLKRDFNHLNLELTQVNKTTIRVDVWFALRKQLACLRTICSHIENLVKGVQYVSITQNFQKLGIIRLYLLISIDNPFNLNITQFLSTLAVNYSLVQVLSKE